MRPRKWKRWRTSSARPIEAQAKILRKMDPSGGNSNIGTDHDVLLNLLANDYPAALAAAAGGDDKPLADVSNEFDKPLQENGCPGLKK
jgi:hypothetical protein